MSDKKIVPFAVYTHKERAAPSATSGGWVRGMYLDVIEYTTSAKNTRGAAFLIGGVGTLLGSGFMCWLIFNVIHRRFFQTATADWFDYFVVVPSFFVFLLIGIWSVRFFGRMEFFQPQDLPILFDRQRRKVYRLIEDLDEHGKPTRKGQGKFIEHDWDDIVAEHHVTTATTGSSVQRHHTLVLMVRDKLAVNFQGPITPSNLPPYVDGFGLGDAKVLSEFSTPRVWEHLRRYMNENGPSLPPGETVADTSVPVTWWDSLGAVSVFGPGYDQRWVDNWGWMLIMHLLMPITLPLALLMATTNWLSYKTAYPVQWPQEVLDLVGPPLSIDAAGALSAQGKRIQRNRKRRGRV